MTYKTSEQYIIRRKKIDHLKKLKINPFGNKFIRTHCIKNIIEEFQNYDKLDLVKKNEQVTIAGRIILKREQGKAGFLHLQDYHYKIQIYIKLDLIGDKAFELYKNSDLGDIIGISGILFKTKTNELTIKANDFIHLTKALLPLPDKYKGLKNKEIIRKRRYIDLIMNSKTREIFFLRSQIIKNIRNFFDNKNFLEVETPTLQSILGGATAKPFVTYHNDLESNFYLRIATELSLKKLIVGGLEAVYEIGKVFRNEGIDASHNPEFTSLEIYLAFADMRDMMNLTKQCLKDVCKKTLKTLEFKYQNHIINFNKFEEIHILDAIKQKTGINFWNDMNLETAKNLSLQHQINILPHFSIGHIIEAFFEKYVEKELIQPTFIYGHPIEISPLAKTNQKDKRLTDRFELFIVGKEFANAFSELNDPIEQEKRFLNQLEQKKLGNQEANEMDLDFIEALEYGMPPTGGMGLGIDRLVMLLTNVDNINDVILFPHFKNQKKEDV
ncbi:Lysyl-tRNA synthetase [Candidatus Phytoplasma mali]|uniref:Lysine--tRNA ligase n=1 Tax=Phytoplasma mali (strain AT) TaxID=482235 RepID=B3R0B9_PHYMT|nr:lysine--tRNA ligase [Candidatus Phytoplasma mali]CAP18283.1 Lysyl-tRNA synthetase [Candidatus Phytoplasma mali]